MPVPKRQLEDDEYKAYKLAQRKFFREQAAKWSSKSESNIEVVKEEDDLPF